MLQFSPISGGKSWQEKADTVADIFSLMGMAQGLAMKATGFFRARQMPVGGHWFFRYSGFLGLAGLFWNSYRAFERLAKKRYQRPAEGMTDLALGVAGLIAGGNICVGLWRGAIFKTITAEGLAFHDQLDRLDKVQAVLIACDFVLDGVSTAYLLSDLKSDPTWERGFEIVCQVGLWSAFGFDRQARTQLKSLVGGPNPVEEIGREIGSALARARTDGAHLIRRDPYYIGAMLLEELGIPRSVAFGAAHHYRETPQKELRRINEATALLSHKVLSKQMRGRSGLLASIPLDELLVAIVRHSSRGANVSLADLERAKAMVLSGQFQHYLIRRYYGMAKRDRFRVGPELEVDPPRHLTETIPPEKSLMGIEEKRPLTRTEIMREIRDDLVKRGWERDGWTITLEAPREIRLAKDSYVYLNQVVSFVYEGKRYTIHSRQSSGNNMVLIWVDGEYLELKVPIERGWVNDPEDSVLRRVQGNFDRVIEELAIETARNHNGKEPRDIAMGMKAAIAESGGPRYLHCHLKAGGLQKWSYEPDPVDPTKGRVRLDSVRLRGTDDHYLPGKFNGIEGAYRYLRRIASNGHFDSGAPFELESVEECTRLILRRRDLSLELESTLEANVVLEFVIHNMTAGGDCDQFYESFCETLRRLGAAGTGNGQQTALQLHGQMDHHGGRNYSILPTVEATRSFFYYLPLFLPGMPPRRFRVPHIQMPAIPPEFYADPPELRVRQRHAVLEIVGDKWGQIVGDKVWLTDEKHRDLRFYVVNRYLRLFEEHSSIWNLDNITAYLMRNAYRQESPSQTRLRQTPAPPPIRLMARRPGVVDGPWEHPATLGELSPEEAVLEEQWRHALAHIRSIHGAPIPTAEIRFPNTPDERVDGEYRLSVKGVMHMHRFMAALMFAGQRGDLMRPYDEIGVMLHRKAGEYLRRYLAGGSLA